MKRTNVETLPLKYNLQFFAEGEGSESAQGNEGSNEDQNSNDNAGEKTFTQSEVSGMMTKEKNEGKRSVLKSLGFRTEEDAKKAIEEYNKFLESQKSEAEKNKEALERANNERSEALKRATDAENKLAVYGAGVNAEYVDDVLAIATLKVTDDKTLDMVLKEMKEDKKYESFFVKDAPSGTGGTGSNAGHSNGHNDSGNDGYGKRLAEKNKANNNIKSSFFND